MTTSQHRPKPQAPPDQPNRPGRWRHALVRLLGRLVEPADTVPVELRRRSRLLSGLLLALLLLVGFALAVSFLANPAADLLPGVYLPVTAGGSALIALAFLLNRAGYYRTAAALTTAVTILGVWAAILLNHTAVEPVDTLIPYVLLPLLLCSLLLSARLTVALAAAQLAVLLAIPWLLPDLPVAGYSGLFVFVSFITILIVVSAVMSQRAQADLDRQRKAQAESDKRFRLLFSVSPDAILVINPNSIGVPWAIVDCNE